MQTVPPGLGRRRPGQRRHRWHGRARVVAARASDREAATVVGAAAGRPPQARGRAEEACPPPVGRAAGRRLAAARVEAAPAPAALEAAALAAAARAGGRRGEAPIASGSARGATRGSSVATPRVSSTNPTTRAGRFRATAPPAPSGRWRPARETSGIRTATTRSR